MPKSLLSFFAVFLFSFLISLAPPAQAQEQFWIQIEARPSQPLARERALDYAQRLDRVEGYRLPSGWYAVALGPYPREQAASLLSRLRSARLVPGDSFLADGRGFREQFWPPFGTNLSLNPNVLNPAPEPPQPVIPEGETLEEARAATRALTRAEREEVQRALQWDGFYTARIDGSFGPGTRRAIEAWQLANAHPTTGVLQTTQRLSLIEEFQTALRSLGFAEVRDEQAGIQITLPAAMVLRGREESPFVTYDQRDGSGVKILLISLPGDQQTLNALYDVMQSLEIVPLQGDRNLGRRDFNIFGENTEVISETYARVERDGVKGFTLIWPKGDEKRRQRALSEMRQSFASIQGQILPSETAPLEAATRQTLLAGFEIRQPERSFSGFYVDASGRVVTAAAPLDGCARITLGDGEGVLSTLALDGDLGFALLTPEAQLRPIRYASFAGDDPRPGSEIAVSGYSFGGILGAPTLSFGRVEGLASLDGREELTRLAMLAEPGDVGGAILDARGAVSGLLLPPPRQGNRALPEDVRYAADADALAAFLSQNGVTAQSSDAGATLHPTELSRQAADMTVLLRCWN